MLHYSCYLFDVANKTFERHLKNQMQLPCLPSHEVRFTWLTKDSKTEILIFHAKGFGLKPWLYKCNSLVWLITQCIFLYVFYIRRIAGKYFAVLLSVCLFRSRVISALLVSDCFDMSKMKLISVNKDRISRKVITTRVFQLDVTSLRWGVSYCDMTISAKRLFVWFSSVSIINEERTEHLFYYVIKSEFWKTNCGMFVTLGNKNNNRN